MEAALPQPAAPRTPATSTGSPGGSSSSRDAPAGVACVGVQTDPIRVALRPKRKAEGSFYEHSDSFPATKVFRTAIQEQKVELAHEQALRSRNIPKVHNPSQVYDDMRRKFFLEYFDRRKSIAESDSESVRSMRLKARLAFSRLSVVDRIALARRAAVMVGISPEQKQDLENKAICLEAMRDLRQSEGKRYVQAKGMLNTYNSTKYLLFEKPEKVVTVADAVRYLTQNAYLQALFARFVEFTEDVAEKKMKATQWSASAELCLETFAKQEVLRVHLHNAFHRSGSIIEFADARQAGLIFEGIIPHNNIRTIPGVFFSGKQNTMLRRANSRADANFMALHYYCQCENKHGSLMRDGSKLPFTGYVVKGSWITSWRQVIDEDLANKYFYSYPIISQL